MLSPPRTPIKARAQQEIIDLDSSSPAHSIRSQAPLAPAALPHPTSSFWSDSNKAPLPPSPSRPRALPVYSPSCRSALTPTKIHPFHAAAIHPNFERGKQPDFTSRREERVVEGSTSAIVYPLHRASSIPPPLPSPGGSGKEKRFRGKVVVVEDKENAREIVVIGTAKGKERLKEFSLKDNEWGKRPPMVIYSRCSDEVDELVGCLRGPLSFDMEWPISRRKGQECKTALIQIGDAKMIVLCQLSAMNHRVPPALLKILCDPKMVKLGVNIRGDALKLRRDFGHRMRGFLEISHMARALDPLSTGPGKAIISLANLTAHYLSRHLPKPPLRTGDWTAVLSPDAIAYAGSDVLSALLVFKKLVGILERDEREAGKEGWEGPRKLEERRGAWTGDLVREEEEAMREAKEKREESERVGKE